MRRPRQCLCAQCFIVYVRVFFFLANCDELISFHEWPIGVCYWSVNATAGEQTLIRPDAFSVPAVHGVWEEWSPWSLCSFTCGRGHRTRTRMCAPPQHGGRACDGPETQTKLCNIALCPGIACLLSLYYSEPPSPPNPEGFNDERVRSESHFNSLGLGFTQPY